MMPFDRRGRGGRRSAMSRHSERDVYVHAERGGPAGHALRARRERGFSVSEASPRGPWGTEKLAPIRDGNAGHPSRYEVLTASSAMSRYLGRGKHVRVEDGGPADDHVPLACFERGVIITKVSPPVPRDVEEREAFRNRNVDRPSRHEVLTAPTNSHLHLPGESKGTMSHYSGRDVHAHVERGGPADGHAPLARHGRDFTMNKVPPPEPRDAEERGAVRNGNADRPSRFEVLTASADSHLHLLGESKSSMSHYAGRDVHARVERSGSADGRAPLASRERGFSVSEASPRGPWGTEKLAPIRDGNAGRPSLVDVLNASADFKVCAPEPNDTEEGGTIRNDNAGRPPGLDVSTDSADARSHSPSDCAPPTSENHRALKDVPGDGKESTEKDIVSVSFPITDVVFSHHCLPRKSMHWDVRSDIGPVGLELYDKWHSGCENAVVDSNNQSGLSRKCLTLLKLLLKEYRTLKTKTAMIVYVRNPTVSITLREVLRWLPVFRQVRAEVLLGKRFEAQSLVDSRRSIPVGGDMNEDTRTLNAFRNGELNVLIVDSSNLPYIRKNYSIPYAACVADFVDGKTLNYKCDPDILKCRIGPCRLFTFKRIGERNVGVVVKKSSKKTQRKQEDESPKLDNSLPKMYQKVPRALLGPKDGDETSYLYALVLPHESGLSDVPQARKGTRVRTMFGVVLSEKLLEEDLELQLQVLGLQSKRGAKPVVLRFVGPLKLGKERLDAIREYNAMLFHTLLKHVKKGEFAWDLAPLDYSDYSIDHEGRGLEYLMNYVVIPLNTQFEINSPLMDALDAIDFPSIGRTKREVLLNRFRRDDKESLRTHIENLEGCLACAHTTKGIVPKLVGFTREDLSPLSTYEKNKKFALMKNGSLVEGQCLHQLTRAVQVEDPEGIAPLIPDFPECSLKTNIFSPKSNRDSNRKFWSGRVRLSFLDDLNRKGVVKVNIKDQPLMVAVDPALLNADIFNEVLTGRPLRELVCKMVQDIADNDKKDDPDESANLIVPEVAAPYFPMDSLLLPCLLYSLERHVSFCQLREELLGFLGIRLPLDLLVPAITPRSINEHENFERMELLGDRILGFHITLRNMVRKPCEGEKTLHNEKVDTALNAHLSETLETKGWIIDRINFSGQQLSEWMPPGSHKIGCCLSNLNHKSFSDLTESLGAAFFMCEYNKARSEMAEVETENDMLNNSCVWRGVEAGGRFFEKLGIFDNIGDGDCSAQPAHGSLLKSMYATLHNRNSCSRDRFPYDRRVSSKNWEYFSELEEKLGYGFKHRNLLIVGCTLKSYRDVLKFDLQDGEKLDPSRVQDLVVGYKNAFERLEFLGDELVGLYVIENLYLRYPNADQGVITGLKSKCVSNEVFGRIVLKNNMDKFMYFTGDRYQKDFDVLRKKIEVLSPAELDQIDKVPPKFLGDFFEACLGAIFLDAEGFDAGFRAVFGVLDRLMKDTLNDYGTPENYIVRPEEELVSFIRRELGLDASKLDCEAYAMGHSRYGARVTLMKEEIGSGEGTSKKRAKLLAYSDALAKLRNTRADAEVKEMIERMQESHSAAMRGSELK